MNLFEGFNHIGLMFFALVVLSGVIMMGGVASAATHTSSVDLQPEWSAANSNVQFTVTFCKESGDTVNEVRIYKDWDGSIYYTNFQCDDKPGWEKLFISAYPACFYVADINSPDYDPLDVDGECEDFTFSADSPGPEYCDLEWKFETRDTKDYWQYLYDHTSVDDEEPVIIKTLGQPQVQKDSKTWITQDTPIHIEVYDTGECGISGLDYCEYRYDVDGVEVLPWTVIDWDTIDEIEDVIHYYYTFNYEEDSEHFLEIRCYDVAENMAYHSQTEKVDDTPPTTTKTYGEPSFPEDINEGAPYPHFITTGTPITLDAPDGGEICAIGTEKMWYYDQLVPDIYCENEFIPMEENLYLTTGFVVDQVDFCHPVCPSPYDVNFYGTDVSCAEAAQELCVEAEDWVECVEHIANECMYEAGYDCDSDWKLYTGDPIYKDEESCHVLQFLSADELGNHENMNWQCVFVDDTPPDGVKDIDGPMKPLCSGDKVCEEETGDWWVTNETEITLSCDDSWNGEADHPVDNERVCFIISFDEPEYPTWITNQYCGDLGGTMCDDGKTCCIEDASVTFKFKEDSLHDLEWYCEDALGNAWEVADLEWFRVDSEPPTIYKDIYGPTWGDCPPDEEDDICFISDLYSHIETNAVDGGETCAIGYVNCGWWYKLDGEENYEPNMCEGPYCYIQFEEDTVHELHVVCEDLLGNVAEDVEVFHVDSQPPETKKDYAGPFYEFEGMKWIDTASTIVLTAEDKPDAPCASGVYETYYNIVGPVDDDYCSGYCEEWQPSDPEDEGWQVYGDQFGIDDESCHIIEYYSVDNLEHQEAVQWQCIFVDKTPPAIEKIIGDNNVPCDPELTVDNGDGECVGTPTYPDSCAELSYDLTPAECNAVPGCSPEAEPFGCNGELPGCQEIMNYEDCVATMGCFWDYWCLGEVACSDLGEDTCELVVGCEWSMANTEPWCDYYINQDTPITFICQDQGDHPSNDVTIYWNIYIEDNGGWQLIHEFSENAPEVTWSCHEDSRHKIEYWCEDAVQKSSPVYTEIDIVDTVPPEIEKWLVGPYSGDCPEVGKLEHGDCYVDSATELWLEATDPEPHPVDDVECWWWYEVFNGESTTRYPASGVYSTLPITFPEESEHTLYIVCEDALGNRVEDKEIFYADHTPPGIWKEYGTPYEVYQFEDYWAEWISSLTPIYGEAYDQGPHLSGIKEVKYRTTRVDDEYCRYYGEVDDYECEDAIGEGTWTYVDDPEDFDKFKFTIDEDSCHLIEIVATDNVDKSNEHKQCVFVDNQGPDPLKEVGEPKEMWDGADSMFYPGIEDYCWNGQEDEIECWKVTTLTPIVMDCEDAEPHPVDHERICFNVNFDGDEYTQHHCNEDEGGEIIYDEEDKPWCCYEYDEYADQEGVWLYFSEESEHELEFFCEDILGNKGPLDVEKFTVEGTAFEIPIFKKWNLISVPFQLLNSDPDEVFENISEEVEAVWTYDPETEEWLAYFPDDEGASDLMAIEPGWGYWLLANDDTWMKIGGSLFKPGPYVPVERLLKEGWNLIGYYGTEWQDYEDPIMPCEYGRGLPFKNIVYNSLYSLMGEVFVEEPKGSGFFFLKSYDEWATPNWRSLWAFQTCGVSVPPEDQPYWLPLDYDNYMYPGYGYWIHMNTDDYYAPSFKTLEEDHCFPFCAA